MRLMPRGPAVLMHARLASRPGNGGPAMHDGKNLQGHGRETAQDGVTGRHGSGSKVAVLLCTYNGERYLREQLDSIEAQLHSHWEMWVSDDGSTDGTRAILEDYRARWHQPLTICRGPASGFAANFMSITRGVASDADYFAYSDQDDIWEADKLARAVEWLDTVPADIPALYCSRARYVAEDGTDIGLSTPFARPLSFRNALVQSIAGGNTMVFNRAARQLMVDTPDNVKVKSHDWWIYMLVTATGGRVYFDLYPSLRYRQHGNNLAGQNVTLGAQAARARALLAGDFREWNEDNLRGLQQIRQRFTADSLAVLDTFSRARSRGLVGRLCDVRRAGVYRQTVLGNLGLLCAAVFNKL